MEICSTFKKDKESRLDSMPPSPRPQTNHAAWLRTINQPLEIGPSDIHKPGRNELLIKNHAIAINPIDWMIQYGAYPAGQLPLILGSDVAGEIVEVGNSDNNDDDEEVIAHFHTGQRVLAHCTALNTDKARCGGFQEYTVVPTLCCSPIPDHMSYEDACVLPLALSTAALGLFHRDQLGLRMPVHGEEGNALKQQVKMKQMLLVWGGSSSVGSAAIQLAVAAGYYVLTTSSARNFALCEKVGAKEVYDHSSPTVVEDLVKAMKMKVDDGYEYAGGFDGE